MVITVPIACRCVACGGIIEKGTRALFEQGSGTSHEKCPEPSRAS